MKVVAAYLLAGLGGNAAPSEADIKKILSSGAWRRRGCGASCSMRGCGGRHAAAVGGVQRAACRRLAQAGSAGLQGGACSAGGRLLTAGPLLPCLPAAVGIEADSERVSKLLSELEGKDIAEVRSRRRPRGRCCLLPLLQGGGAPGGSTEPWLRAQLCTAAGRNQRVRKRLLPLASSKLGPSLNQLAAASVPPSPCAGDCRRHFQAGLRALRWRRCCLQRRRRCRWRCPQGGQGGGEG